MKFLKILYVQVIIGIALGVAVGYYYPAFAPTAKLISDTFINMIRMVIAPLIFFTIVSGIVGAGNLKKVGRVGGKAFLYFEVVTTLAMVIGIVIANLVQPGAGVSQEITQKSSVQVEQYAEQATNMNWGEFFAHIININNTSGIKNNAFHNWILYFIFFLSIK